MVNIAGFPGVGPIGNVGLIDAQGTTNGVLVGADGALTIGGFLAYSILAEMRVQTFLLQIIANNNDSLKQLRADAIADMGVLYAANPTTPVPSS